MNKTLDDLVPLIINAPAETKTRNKWLERLWQAMEDDGVDSLRRYGVEALLAMGKKSEALKYAEASAGGYTTGSQGPEGGLGSCAAAGN